MTLAPLVFEIHHDQANDQGRSGLIGSPKVADNPTYQALQRDFGEYSPNYSFDTHGGYGGPQAGMALLELGRSYKDWTPEMITANTDKLWNSLMSVDAIKSGQRPLHFFVGHGDVVTGQTGAPGEREMNRAVIKQLQERAEAAGLKNFSFYKSHPVVYGKQGGPKDNWTRARNIVAGKDGGLRFTPLAAVTPGEQVDSPPTFPSASDVTGVTDTSPTPADSARPKAKARAKEYSKMSKAEMNTAYDALRASDPNKAAVEGMKMHKAFFNKK